MNLDDLTLGQVKQLQSVLGASPTNNRDPYIIGQAYLIRTVTHYYTGRLSAIFSQELLLEEAAWIADTGRYHNALKTGELSEVEPIIGPLVIGRGAIIDAVYWPNSIPLPKDVK